MDYNNHVVSLDNHLAHVADGNSFETRLFFTVPANSVYWYRVTIPEGRVIATQNRIWTSDLGNCTLELFANPTGGTLGTVWPTSNKNRQSSKTTSVVIQSYTTPPTVTASPTGNVDDFIPSGAQGSKSQGGYNPQTTFRIYAPAYYAGKLTNANNADCRMMMVYEYLDVLQIAQLG